MSHQSRILRVDLTSRTTSTEVLDQDRTRLFLGGRGINAGLLWRQLPPHVDPLGPENPLIFGAGVLGGTAAPASGRVTVTCKSPATGLYLKSNAGGEFAASLRFAGYDHLVVEGTADAPVYILINGSSVQVLPANHLWGKDVRETHRTLARELSAMGINDIDTAVIGPAGENLVKFASIMCSLYSALARGGPGAVMGSKRLKAIVVRGDGGVQVARPEQFDRLAVKAHQVLREADGFERYRAFGTAGGVNGTNALRAFPSYNFTRGHVDDSHLISGQHMAEAGYLKHVVSCFSCPVACHRYTEIDHGPWAGTYSGGPEYETISSFGSGCGMFDIETVIKANELCNILGLDTISAGGVIQWLIECGERGVMSAADAGDLELRWGNRETVIELIRRIAYREGIGNILAEGVKRAAAAIGHDSWKWAIEAKGLEQSRVETRSAKGYALAFAVNPRGPDHLHAAPIGEFGTRPGTVRVIEKITGDAKYANPYLTDKRAEIVRWHEDWVAAFESAGMCMIVNISLYGLPPALVAELFNAAAGEDLSEEEFLRAGRRILTLEKCINTREGASRVDDTLPWRLMHEELPDRPGAINSPEELNLMLDQYYSLHGWDVETGLPTRSTLEALGLHEQAEDLARLGVLKD